MEAELERWRQAAAALEAMAEAAAGVAMAARKATTHSADCVYRTRIVETRQHPGVDVGGGSASRRMSLHPFAAVGVNIADSSTEHLLDRLEEHVKQCDLTDIDVGDLRERHVLVNEANVRMENDNELMSSQEGRDRLANERLRESRERIEETLQKLRIEVENIRTEVSYAREQMSSFNENEATLERLRSDLKSRQETSAQHESERDALSGEADFLDQEIQRLRELREQSEAVEPRTQSEKNIDKSMEMKLKSLDEEIRSIKDDIKSKQVAKQRYASVEESSPAFEAKLESTSFHMVQCDPEGQETPAQPQSPYLVRAIHHLIQSKSREEQPFAVVLSILNGENNRQMPLNTLKKMLGQRIGDSHVVQTVYAMVGQRLISIDRTQSEHKVISLVHH